MEGNLTVQSLMIGAAGNISISASRSTSNIKDEDGNPVALPFVIFGSNDFAGNYRSFLQYALKKLNPPGSTNPIRLTISTSATGNVLFTYTQGVVQDIVTVSYVGTLNSYSAMLKSMNNTYFKSSLFIYSINDIANTGSQIMENIIQIGSIGSLSYSTQNEIPLNSMILPEYQRDDRVSVIFAETDFVPDTGILDAIQPPASLATFVVTYAVYMSKTINLNRIHTKKIEEE